MTRFKDGRRGDLPNQRWLQREGAATEKAAAPRQEPAQFTIGKPIIADSEELSNEPASHCRREERSKGERRHSGPTRDARWTIARLQSQARCSNPAGMWPPGPNTSRGLGITGSKRYRANALLHLATLTRFTRHFCLKRTLCIRLQQVIPNCARVRVCARQVPDDTTVVMSASRSRYSKAERVFHFSMDAPVPAYLVALVAGNLRHADVGPRSRVWAEPCLLSCAAKKLAGSVERLLTTAEGLFGQYLWGRCDLVFLPPAFPMVAMENPCLTFMVASILESGDFLLIDVAHEMAHAWFGNAVTHASWEEMWLSEGLATYAQRRITTRAYGAAFTCLESAVRLDALHRQLRLLGDDNPVTRLQVKLQPGVNPSTLMNLFTYEKGFCFVSYLSSLCGDVGLFDRFLQDYISRFKFQSVVARDFLDLFLATFPEAAQKEGVDFQRWLTGCGAPPQQPDLSAGAALTQPVREACRAWSGGGRANDTLEAAALLEVAGWSTFQVVLFLDCMLDRAPLPHEVMSQMRTRCASLLDGLNAEVQVRWLQLVVRSLFYPDVPRLAAFLRKHTSRMYTVPLYEDLSAGAMRGVAADAFRQTRRRLHPDLQRTLQQIMAQGRRDADAAPPPRPPDAVAVVPLRDVDVSA